MEINIEYRKIFEVRYLITRFVKIVSPRPLRSNLVIKLTYCCLDKQIFSV